MPCDPMEEENINLLLIYSEPFVIHRHCSRFDPLGKGTLGFLAVSQHSTSRGDSVGMLTSSMRQMPFRLPHDSRPFVMGKALELLV